MTRAERSALIMKKPTLPTRSAEAMEFADQAAAAVRDHQARLTERNRSRAELKPPGRKSGLIPAGDVRLTANIAADLHRKLKMRAVQRGTTIGELIEEWIRSIDQRD